MDSSTGRFTTIACWVLAVAAMVSAGTHAALGVAALWSLPAALVVSVAYAAWPQHRLSRVLGIVGLAWQVALIIAYWPFERLTAEVAVASGGLTAALPLHALLIAAVLLTLAIAFAALFVVPALGLLRRLSGMVRVLQSDTPTDTGLHQAIGSDAMLDRAWREYLSHLRPGPDGARLSDAAARNFLNLSTVGETRLRVDFFRHLPGIFTGIGIIGTFSGLIMGLRAFRISDDTSVVQSSLNGLLQGVWESFLISAAAILLAILVTIAEKVLIAALARRFEMVARLLDNVFPLHAVAPAADGTTQRTLRALESLVEKLPAMASQGAGLMPEHAPAAAMAAASAASTTTALERLTQRLDEYLSEQVKASAAAQQQANQAMKTLSSRLEMVASGIESSGRKTLEVVAARLMDAQLHMSSRHQAMTEQMVDVVSRIETLCTVIQRDHGVGSAMGENFELAVRDNEMPGHPGRGAGGRPREQGQEPLGSGWAAVPPVNPHGANGLHFSAPGQFAPHMPFGFGGPPLTRPGAERFGS